MFDALPNSPKNRFRAARIEILKGLVAKTLTEKTKCRILDIGGTFGFWNVWGREFDWQKIEVVCANLDPTHAEDGKENSSITMIQGNACDLNTIRDKEFDIVFSNSVIEHVGLWRNMQSMAREVQRIAPRYLIQTPNYWFPIEPHARTPFLHWLPEPLGYRVVMARKCGFWTKAKTVSQAMLTLQSAKMLDFNQLKELFPNALIKREKFFGLTKALMAIRD